MSQDASALTLQTLTRFLVSDSRVDETLQRIAAIACDAIPAAEVAGTSLPHRDRGPVTSVYTDETSEAVHQRAVIEHAEGVLTGTDHDLSPEGAFRVPGEAAGRRDVGVREVAQRVVDERDPSASHA